ncbi:hypothetical protein FRB98_006061 [Tulasnella sp. 332]|nr:hypothetical protein FRB98_006061 [Tulasnella sp. 332]
MPCPTHSQVTFASTNTSTSNESWLSRVIVKCNTSIISRSESRVSLASTASSTLSQSWLSRSALRRHATPGIGTSELSITSTTASQQPKQDSLHYDDGLSMRATTSNETVDVASKVSDGDRVAEREKWLEQCWKSFFEWAEKDWEMRWYDERPHLAQNNAGTPGTGQEPYAVQWDLSRTIGYVTATGSEDWTLFLNICERASTESGAEEAAKVLRMEFIYARPPPMLNAARLWAVMFRYRRAPFLKQCSSKKFIESVEDCVFSHTTSPVVQERLILIIGGVAAQHGDQYPAFRALWRKVKNRYAPKDGIPLDPRDTMFSPPARRLPKSSSFTGGSGGSIHSLSKKENKWEQLYYHPNRWLIEQVIREDNNTWLYNEPWPQRP